MTGVRLPAVAELEIARLSRGQRYEYLAILDDFQIKPTPNLDEYLLPGRLRSVQRWMVKGDRAQCRGIGEQHMAATVQCHRTVGSRSILGDRNKANSNQGAMDNVRCRCLVAGCDIDRRVRAARCKDREDRQVRLTRPLNKTCFQGAPGFKRTWRAGSPRTESQPFAMAKAIAASTALKSSMPRWSCTSSMLIHDSWSCRRSRIVSQIRTVRTLTAGSLFIAPPPPRAYSQRRRKADSFGVEEGV